MKQVAACFGKFCVLGVVVAMPMLMFAPSAVRADVTVNSVGELAQVCGKEASAGDLNTCLALVNLALDNIRSEEQASGVHVVCNMQPINIFDVKQIFSRWAAVSAQRSALDPQLGVQRALEEQYPCPAAVRNR